MNKSSPRLPVDPLVWNKVVATLPGAHLLQTWEWGNLKARFGWQPHTMLWQQDETGITATLDGIPAGVNFSAAALILQRSLPITGFASRMRMLYVPKGPLLDWGNAALRQKVLIDLQVYARQSGSILVKIDPDVCLGTGVPGSEAEFKDPLGQAVQSELTAAGWQLSTEQVQFRNTVTLDLLPGEDELLANMKQKTRYNIRLAMRKGVSIRRGTQADLPLLYQMYAETSVRDGFVIRNQAYYLATWQAFLRSAEDITPSTPWAEPLIAEVGGQPVAALILMRFANKAWYMYGMSRDAHRELMPNYLLQWEAIRHLHSSGCQVYDLWGAPDEFAETDALWGVYRFKEGLGGKVVRFLGAYDYPANPPLYQLYQRVLPRLLDILRSRGRKRTRQSLN